MSQRIKFTRPIHQYRAGETVVVDNNVAHGYIEQGVAMLTKDLVATQDYKVKKLSSKRPRKAQDRK